MSRGAGALRNQAARAGTKEQSQDDHGKQEEILSLKLNLRQRRLRSPALADGRCPARQHGRRRVQARLLGLLFLKYISDAFEEKHAALLAEKAQGADPEDPDEYRAQSIFWVPPEARWPHLKAQARQATIGQLVDDAMAAIERDNPALKGVLPKDYARPALDKQRLGQLIDMISNIKVGDEASRAKDVLGRVYEYFLSQFASAEGKKGGEFYTPRCVVKLLVEMLEPYRGRVYDPCCGSSGMFVQSVEFIRAHAKAAKRMPRPTSRSTARSRTTPPGAWRA